MRVGLEAHLVVGLVVLKHIWAAAGRMGEEPGLGRIGLGGIGAPVRADDGV